MDITSSFTSWWQGLQAREQRILLIGGILLGLLLIYWVVVDPVYSGRDRARQNLEAARQSFQVMRQQATDIEASTIKTKYSSSGSLLTLVESSAQQQGLRDGLKNLQPSGDNQIQVTLEGASYQQLMQWLIGLNKQGVTTHRADIQSDAKDKLLRAQLLLGR